jgi:predicted RNA binding protein YcfA (HicA-like mRNA interferase family)
MAALPALSAVQVVRALKAAGFIEDRQRGSHLVLFHPGTKARTVVPMHSGKTIFKPLLRAIIKDAGLTVEQFIELL